MRWRQHSKRLAAGEVEPDCTDMRFEDIVRAATSMKRLKKGSDVSMRPTRVVLLLRARAVKSEGSGGAGYAAFDGRDDDNEGEEIAAADAKNASSTYLKSQL